MDLQWQLFRLDPAVPFRATGAHQNHTWARTFHSHPDLYIQPQTPEELREFITLARSKSRGAGSEGKRADLHQKQPGQQHPQQRPPTSRILQHRLLQELLQSQSWPARILLKHISVPLWRALERRPPFKRTLKIACSQGTVR